MTPPATFDAAYNNIVSQLTAGGRKGVIANLPYVTTLPYFYVIKYNQLTQANLTVGGTSLISTPNTQLYGPLRSALTFLGQGDRINLLSTTDNNPMLMVDENLTDLSTSLTAVLVGGGLDCLQQLRLVKFLESKTNKTNGFDMLVSVFRIGKAPVWNWMG